MSEEIDIAHALDLRAKSSEDELVGAGAALIRSWHRIEESKTAVLKDLAIVIVKLRSRFRTPDGDVDWAGHSWEYRQAAGRMYEMASVPPDSVAGVQAAIRYHVGNVLREVVKPKELEAAGLLPTSPRERLQQVRDVVAALTDALTATQLPPGTSGRFVRSVTAARAALDVAAQDVDGMPTDALLHAADELGAVIERATETLDRIRDALDRAPQLPAADDGQADVAPRKRGPGRPRKRGVRPD